MLACLAAGCSGHDETRVVVDDLPGGSSDERKDERRLEPAGPEAPDGAGGSSGAEQDAPEPLEEPTTLPVAGGTATDNRSRPWIDDLSDWRVRRGEGVLLSGGQLLPNPSVLLGNRVVTPLESSLTSLKFVVPDDLELARCEVTFRLFVKTDNGLSPSIELAILQPPPKIALVEARVGAGQAVSLRVEPEGARVVQLESPGREDVRLELSSDGNLRIPPSTPEGPAILRWITACGDAVVAIDVEPWQMP
jgi:hypothetical protein